MRLLHPDQRLEQGGLAGPVAAHERHHLARAQRGRDAAQRRDPAVARDQVLDPGHDRAGRRHPVAGARRADRVSRNGPARRRASRTDSGSGSHPAIRPELDDRRGDRSRREHVRRVSPRRAGRPVAGDEDHPVGVLHHPLEPVLGEDHGDAEVVHQALQGREDVLGGQRVERRGGLVEHQHARVRGEHGADRDPLLLSAGERRAAAGPCRSARPSRSRVSSTRRRITSVRQAERLHRRRRARPRPCR